MEQEILEEQNSQPLLGEAVTPSCLISEYQHEEASPGFIPGIQYLNGKYESIRRIRGDGNCFYRGFLFSYFEKLFHLYQTDSSVAEIERQRLLSKIAGSRQDLINIGYDEFAFECFLDEINDLVENLFTKTSEDLFSIFNSNQCDYYTWFLRLIAALRLRQDPHRFLPFVSDSLALVGGAENVEAAMAEYCQREVEPMGKECEQLQIIALAEYLEICVSIEYLDGRTFDPAIGLSLVKLGPSLALPTSCPIGVDLLYRPGHYDVLYPSKYLTK